MGWCVFNDLWCYTDVFVIKMKKIKSGSIVYISEYMLSYIYKVVGKVGKVIGNSGSTYDVMVFINREQVLIPFNRVENMIVIGEPNE